MNNINGIKKTFTVADWIEEMRTTEKKQAYKYLKEHDEKGPRYCCLGLACELSGLGQFHKIDNDDPHVISEYVFVVGEETPLEDIKLNEGTTGELPEEVMELLNLRTSLGEFTMTTEWITKLRRSAPQVANKVERYAFDTQGRLERSPMTLANLNDNALTFSEIAEVIESNPQGLFV